MVETSGTNTFSEEEVQLYDRQIRLWGVEAQHKIRTTKILMIGLEGLATEVVKNLALTGIESITMLDDQPVTQSDMLSNLFSRNQIGKKRSEACQEAVLELNPRVKVKIQNGPLSQILSNKNEAEEFLKSFDAVILVNHDLDTAINLNQICNELKVPFFFSCAWGYLSMTFIDLGKDFVSLKEALEKKNITLRNSTSSKRDAIKISTLKSIFVPILTIFKYHQKYGKFPILLNEDETDRCSLDEQLKTFEQEILSELNSNVNNCSSSSNDNQHQKQLWSSMKDWHSKIFGQFTFISSIVGGFLSQEVIRAVTKDKINYNLFLLYEINGHNVNIGL